MSARRSAVLPAVLAAAGVLVAVAAWFLAGEGNAPPAPPPRPPQPEEEARAPRPPVPVEGPAILPPAPVVALPPPLPPGTVAWARLLFVDAATGKALPPEAAPQVSMVEETGEGTLRRPRALYALEGGRYGLVEDAGAAVAARPPRGRIVRNGLEPSLPHYEVRAHGYVTVGDLFRDDLEGEREIRLEPAAAAVRGVLEAGPGLVKGRMFSDLRPAAPPSSRFRLDPRRPRVPTSFGPFSLFDIDAGTWELTVRVEQPGGVWATTVRTFEAGGETVDLGTIVVQAPSMIRARVIGADGTGMLDPGLRVRRVGEGDIDGNSGGEPDAEGWIEFRGLIPDTDYELLCSIEGVTERVRTAAAGGAANLVELRSEIRGVRCRIRFTVKGEEPVKWGVIFEGPTLDEHAWKKDGLLEQEMAPGEYLFGILAEAAGSGKMLRYAAKFTVPDQPSWDVTIDLKDR